MMEVPRLPLPSSPRIDCCPPVLGGEVRCSFHGCDEGDLRVWLRERGQLLYITVGTEALKTSNDD